MPSFEVCTFEISISMKLWFGLKLVLLFWWLVCLILIVELISKLSVFDFEFSRFRDSLTLKDLLVLFKFKVWNELVRLLRLVNVFSLLILQSNGESLITSKLCLKSCSLSSICVFIILSWALFYKFSIYLIWSSNSLSFLL